MFHCFRLYIEGLIQISPEYSTAVIFIRAGIIQIVDICKDLDQE